MKIRTLLNHSFAARFERRMSLQPCMRGFASSSLHFFRFSGLILILSGLLFLAAAPSRLLAAPPAQAPDAPPSVAGGRALWAENCQPCHGPTGQGDGPSAEAIPDPLPDMSNPDTARQYVPIENFEVIKNGRIEKLMPPWGNRLNDAQIWDLTAYVWNLSTTPEELAAGEKLYTGQCAACHGQGGSGDGPEAPAEMIDFTDLQVMTQQSQAGLQANFKASQQHAQLNTLSETELWSALNYIRTFSLAIPKRNGVLSGQVINATTNEPVGNIEVTLRVFEGNAEIERFTTQADSAGNYTFEQLPTDHALLYTLEGRYQDVSYFSNEPGTFVPDSNETELNLAVYDTTTSPEAIGVSQLHYLVAFTPGAVNVIQIFILGNDGDRTYIGQDGQTFSFALPEGVQNVAFQEDGGGTRFIQSETGYMDTRPILPGEEGSAVVVSYELPAEDELTINVPIPAHVTSASVLLQDLGANLSSEQLEFVETRQFQGETFSIFKGADLPQGEPLTLHLTDLDQLQLPAPEPAAPGATAPTPPVDQSLLRWIIIGLGGAVLVAVAAGYPYWRPRLAHQASLAEDPTLRRQKLLLLLARLDEVFEAGELDEQVYRRTRAKYKAELIRVMEE